MAAHGGGGGAGGGGGSVTMMSTVAVMTAEWAERLASRWGSLGPGRSARSVKFQRKLQTLCWKSDCFEKKEKKSETRWQQQVKRVKETYQLGAKGHRLSGSQFSHRLEGVLDKMMF